MQKNMMIKMVAVAMILLVNNLGWTKDSMSIHFNLGSGLTALTKDSMSKKLQPAGLMDTSIEFQYDLKGSGNSMFLGGGYGVQKKRYNHFPSPDNENTYVVAYNYTFITLGYDFHFSGLLLKPSIRFGSGNYNFSGNTSVDETNSAYIVGVDCNIQGDIFNTGLFYKLGLGYSKASFSSISEGSLNNQASEYNEIVTINLGGGFSF